MKIWEWHFHLKKQQLLYTGGFAIKQETEDLKGRIVSMQGIT